MLLADALLHLFAQAVNTPRTHVENGSAAFSDTPGYRVEKYPVGNCKSCYVDMASRGAMMADESEIDRVLAQYGPRPLPDVRPREMREAPLGQSNAIDRLLSMYGQPSLDALRRGFAGQATPQEVARTFLETGPIGPFGMARSPPNNRFLHGTLSDSVPSIRDNYLEPRAGRFVDDAYGSEYRSAGVDLPEMVYLAAQNDPSRAYNAIRAQVARKLGKSYHQVTLDEIRDHGAMVVARPDERAVWQMGEDQTSRNLHGHRTHDYDRAATAEPGDWYSHEAVRPSGIMTGDRLMRYLRGQRLIE